MTGIDTIRQAASLMRQRAQAATGGVWWRDDVEIVAAPSGDYTDPEHAPVTVVNARLGPGDALRRTWEQDQANLDYLASWSPQVALAVASTLDAAADAEENLRATCARLDLGDMVASDGGFHAALLIARVYLGMAKGGEG